MNRGIGLFQRMILAAAIITSLVAVPSHTAKAAANLTITPITWNIIGLDSNNVDVGPNNFPIGVRVCNSGDEVATNVKSSFTFDTADAYIDLRSGTLTAYTSDGTNLNPGECTDFYYEVSVTRDPAAYDHTREYHITATADGGLSVETPRPRELYVEYLISQSRNSVSDVRVKGASEISYDSIPPGGVMNLMVGQTYDIQLIGFTATNGYEQIESFINFPNTIFQVLSVSTDYTADTSPYVTDPDDKLYGDGCLWENDPDSPNYLSCLETGKAGGDIVVTYRVKIIQVPSSPFLNPQGLNTLIYDFSGSSFHYNADFSVSTRYARIINASVSKSFAPKTINPGDNTTLTFTVTNPGPDAITGLNFTDNLPGGITVASPTVTYSNCGLSPTPSSLTIGDTSLPFDAIDISGNSTCTITVVVTGSADSTYINTSQNLYIGTDDTGSFAEDTLVITSKPAAPSSCAAPVTMATWSFENYTASTSANNGPFDPVSVGPDVTLASTYGSYGSVSGSASAVVDTATFPSGWQEPSTTGNTGNSWGIQGGWLSSNPATPESATTPYFEFQVDASDYGGIGLTTDYNLQPNWSNSGNWYILFSTDGSTWSTLNSGVWSKADSWQSAAISGVSTSTGNPTVYFRVFAAGAQYSGNPSATHAEMYLDDVVITGCPRPDPPTLTKAFASDPIQEGAASTLTFTITNTNLSAGLTGLAFDDNLPAGLVIDTPNGLSTTCDGTVSATAGSSLISWSGGTLAASTFCQISVSILGNTAGEYTNTSDSISSTETGPNTTSSGYGEDTLTVIAPPVIAKDFGATSVLTGNSTTLGFTISNPNLSTTLTGLSFSDLLPDGVDVTTGSASACGGTLDLTDNDPARDTVALSGGSLAAGASCTFSVTVSGSSTGLKNNSVTVSSTNGGTGNTATADLLVRDPGYSLALTKHTADSSSGPWRPFLSVYPGDNVYYRFVIENTGDLAQTNVGITDANVDTSGCVWVDGDSPANTIPLNGDGTFTLPAPAAGSEAHIAICVVGPITALVDTHTNTAQATSTEVPAGPTDTATYVGVDPEITLLKQIGTASGGPWSSAITGIAGGSDVYYYFTVTNTGNIPMTSISITDPDVDTSSCTFTDPLAVGASTSCEVGPITAQSTIGIYTNTASATAEGQSPYDPTPGTTYTSNDSSASYTIDSPDLTISKSNDTSGASAVGATFNWVLLVENSGTDPATFLDGQTILTDNLPSGPAYGAPAAGDFTAVTNSGNISCAIVGTTLSCTASGADVTIGESGSFTVTWSVTPADGTTLVNTATVDPGDLIEESDEGNNDANDTVDVAALNIVKEVSTDGSTWNDTSVTVAVGDPVYYRVRVENTGNVTLTNLVVDDGMVGCTLVRGSDLTGNDDAVFEAGEEWVYTCDVTAVAGTQNNTATADTDETPQDSDGASYFGETGSLGLTKSSSTTSATAVGQVIPYDYVITNTGTVILTNVTLSDDNIDAVSGNPTCVPAQPFTLAPGASVNCVATYTVTAGDLIPGTDITNTATVESDQTVPIQTSLDIPVGVIFDPPFGYKDFNDAGLPVLVWRMVWINDSNDQALDVEITDPIPAGTTFAGGLTCEARGTSSTDPGSCIFSGGSIIWTGTMGPDLGATDEFDADNEVVITFSVSIPDNLNSSVNNAVLDADLDNNGTIEADETAVASANAAWTRDLPSTPETGFAPDRVTQIPSQDIEKSYSPLGAVWLEIPRLGVRTTIVGVPIVEDEWDVTWLQNKAGWLEGTAFPTYEGNSVVTAHVYLPSGLPGPFVNLSGLSWDDRVIIHAYGQQYVFSVRSNQLILPDDPKATQHEEANWLTLLTCKGYNEGTGSYDQRVMIRAVLVAVLPDYYH